VNILAHLAAFVSCLWLSLAMFNTLSQPALGYAFLAVAFLALVMAALAAIADWHVMGGGRSE
jgi:hypothetical protein